MALDIKLADAYVYLSLQRTQFDAQMKKVQSDIAALPGKVTINLAANRAQASAAINLLIQQMQAAQQLGKINLTASRAQADASINLLMQHLKAAQALTKFKITATRGAGFGFGGGGGSGGGGARAGFSGAGFGTGAAMGFGMPFAMNPQMMAGQIAGRTVMAAAENTIDLQAQYATLQRISGLSFEQVGRLKQDIFAIASSKANAANLDDLIEIATVGSRMGIADKGGVKGLAEFTEGLAQVKTVINDIPAAKLADDIARTLNNFQLGTQYVRGFGSALTGLDNVSVASAADILNITQRLGGYAQAVGVTLPETAALASLLKDVGISNEVAGTSFGQIFQRMASNSHKFAAAVGIDAREFESAYREGPIKALGLVIQKLATMDDSIEKMQFLDELGLKGQRVSGSLLRLNSVWDRLSSRVAIANKEFGTGEALAAGVKIEAETTASGITRMKSGFRELGDALGSKVNPAISSTAGLLGDVASALANLQLTGFKSADVFGGGPKKLPALPERAPVAHQTDNPDADVDAAEKAGVAAVKKRQQAQMAAEALEKQVAAAPNPGRDHAAIERLNKMRDSAEAARMQADAAQEDEKKALQAYETARARAAAMRAIENRKAALPAAVAAAQELAQTPQKIGLTLAGKGLSALTNPKQGGLAGTLGFVFGGLASTLADKEEKKSTGRRNFSVSDNGLSVGRQLQEQILNADKNGLDEAKKTARNTETAASTLSEIRDIIRQNGNQAIRALLPP